MFDFLYTAVSWVLLRWHDAVTALGLDGAGGANWTLSIVLLVSTMRLLLLPLVARQFADRRRPAEERTVLAGCLPVLASIPMFIALLHVLRHVSNSLGLCTAGDTGGLVRLYSFTPAQTCSASRASFLGAPLAGALRDSATQTSLLVTLVIVAISAAAIVLTQRVAATRATTAPDATTARVQRLMTVVAPGSVLLSAAFLPLGVLVYLMTSNVWTALQQHYFLR